MTREHRAPHLADIERWYHALIDLTADQRQDALNAANVAAELRRELEALLRQDSGARDFLEGTALEATAVSLMLDHQPLAPGQRVGGYEIVALIGAGGMGEVYCARDLRLERDVALKVVQRDTAGDDTGNSRFEAEARAASALAHPGIVTIFAVGEEGDIAYIAMELVHGDTLGARMAGEATSLADALDFAVQIADALAVAHDAGIVHRDLKPDNVMVTPDGRIKVLDFGIAKRAGAGRSDADPIRGTAGYMAPEQANGEPTDHRTDQFAFGAMLYELVAHRRAFPGDTLADTLEAVNSTRPTPVGALNPEVPPVLRALIDRCLEKSPKDRFQSTRDLSVELKHVRARWLSDEQRRRARRRLWWLTSAAAVTAIAGASAWRLGHAGPRARAMAVLPFENADVNPAIDYVCEGLTETLLRRLSFIPGLEVRASSAVFNFRQAGRDARDAGRRLGADTVLTGAVSAGGGRVRVTARLLDVGAGTILWSDHYDRPAGEAQAMTHDIARAIVTEGIRQPLNRDASQLMDRPATDNSDAYDLYLRALYLHRREGEDNLLGARTLLQQAVALDPGFALAQVSLASTFTVMAVDGFERPTDAWPASNRCVRRALELDAGLAEAHAEQASSWFFFDHDWTAAESAWKRAITARSTPTLPDMLSGSALKLWALGRTPEALALIRRARQLDPLTPRFAIQEADVLLNGGRAADAVASYEAVIASHPGEAAALFGLAEACHDVGQIGRAVAARLRGYDVLGDAPPRVSGTDEAAYRALDRLAAEADLAALSQRAANGGYVSPLDSARAHARLGNRPAAFRDLDAAFEELAPGLVFLRVDRAWRAVRDDARFRTAVAAVGLP